MEEIPIDYWRSYSFKRIKKKVDSYNNCGILKKILFSLLHKKNFFPTSNEKNLVYLYNQAMKDEVEDKE